MVCDWDRASLEFLGNHKLGLPTSLFWCHKYLYYNDYGSLIKVF